MRNRFCRKGISPGLKQMKKANGYAKELLAQHPDATDAYIAPGIANYIIGFAERWCSFSCSGLMEFTATKSSAWWQVARTAENGRYLRPFAKISLPRRAP